LKTICTVRSWEMSGGLAGLTWKVPSIHRVRTDGICTFIWWRNWVFENTSPTNCTLPSSPKTSKDPWKNLFSVPLQFISLGPHSGEFNIAGHSARLNGTGGVVLRLARAIARIAAGRPTSKAAPGNLKFFKYLLLLMFVYIFF